MAQQPNRKHITQTAGRDALGTFAPEFAHANVGANASNEWLEPVDDNYYSQLKK